MSDSSDNDYEPDLPDRPPISFEPDLDLLTTDERGGEPPYETRGH